MIRVQIEVGHAMGSIHITEVAAAVERAHRRAKTSLLNPLEAPDE